LGCGQTILVVEDDESVRGLTVAMLKRLGYATLEAEDGPAALRALESAAEIDLLFTDMVLPGGMSGAGVAARAVAIRPDLGILYSSGYTRGEMVHRGRLGVDARLLQKPFSKGDLAHCVHDAMRDPSKGSGV